MPQFGSSRLDTASIGIYCQPTGFTWYVALQRRGIRPRGPPAHHHVLPQPRPPSRVDDGPPASEGLDALAEPFDVGDGFLTVAFAIVDGAVVEFMQYANPAEEGWFWARRRDPRRSRS